MKASASSLLSPPPACGILLGPLAAACLTVSPAAAQFALGVAAGDITDTAAIVWTRADAAGAVRLQVSTDPDFAALEQSIDAEALDETDRTIKIDVSALQPGTEYYYRFQRVADTAAISPVGRFRTAPAPTDAAPLRFVFSGDTNFSHAPFGLMSAAAGEEADFFIWFGDTVYADVPAGGLGVARTLAEYRAKYVQVHGDLHVRALLSRTALIAGWDDHEVRDNYSGLDPDLPVEQKAAAYQAFFEYMPVRPQQIAEDPFRTYRRFRYGASAEFFLLDERQYRETDASAACNGNIDPSGFFLGPLTARRDCMRTLTAPRTLLGREQLEWLKDGLLTSAAPVKLVVNNVPLSFIGAAPYDRWDGYDSERRELLEFIDANQIAGVVFLTTDIHANGYNPDLMRHFRRFRPEYKLDNGSQAAEVIAGPLGNATAHESILAAAERLLDGAPAVRNLLGALERGVLDRIRLVNGFELIEANRVSYAVIDIDADASVRITYRGLPPEKASQADAAVETFFETTIEAAPPLALPCFVPLFAVLLAAAAGRLNPCHGRRCGRTQ